MLTNIHRYYLYSEEQPYLNYDYRRLDTKQFRYRLLIHTNDRQFPLTFPHNNGTRAESAENTVF